MKLELSRCTICGRSDRIDTSQYSLNEDDAYSKIHLAHGDHLRIVFVDGEEYLGSVIDIVN